MLHVIHQIGPQGLVEGLQAMKNHLKGGSDAMGFLHLDLKKVKHLPGSLMLSR